MDVVAPALPDIDFFYHPNPLRGRFFYQKWATSLIEKCRILLKGYERQAGEGKHSILFNGKAQALREIVSLLIETKKKREKEMFNGILNARTCLVDDAIRVIVLFLPV